jgi:hypothetical protein
MANVTSVKTAQDSNLGGASAQRWSCAMSMARLGTAFFLVMMGCSSPNPEPTSSTSEGLGDGGTDATSSPPIAAAPAFPTEASPAWDGNTFPVCVAPGEPCGDPLAPVNCCESNSYGCFDGKCALRDEQ